MSCFTTVDQQKQFTQESIKDLTMATCTNSSGHSQDLSAGLAIRQAAPQALPVFAWIQQRRQAPQPAPPEHLTQTEERSQIYI